MTGAQTGSDHPEDSGSGTSESTSRRLDRKWNELLQELRVAQTGVQILTGFLLTIPFSSRFEVLDETMRTVYLCVLGGSVVATGFLIAPVAFHRSLFYLGERPWLLAAANRTARAGLATLALTVCGVVWLAFAVVASSVAGIVAAGVALLFFFVLWGLVPLTGGRRGSQADGSGGEDADGGSATDAGAAARR